MDRTVDDNKSTSSTEEEQQEPDDQPGQVTLEEPDLFKGKVDALFGASSSESDDRKPEAQRTRKQPHPYEDALGPLDEETLDEGLFADFGHLPEPQNKRTRIAQADIASSMPSLPRVDSAARMPNHIHPGMHLEMPYPSHAIGTPPAMHHPNLHATHNPYANPSPGYASYLHSSPNPGIPQRRHESPHRMVYTDHPYPQQHMMRPRYYDMAEPRHEAGIPVETRSQMLTGENPREFRRGPSPDELANARTARARAALTTWYLRLEDLYRYKVEKGHCEYPRHRYPRSEFAVSIH